MNEKSKQPLRGDAAWRAHRDEIAKRNEAAYARGRRERAAREEAATVQRRQDEQREAAMLPTQPRPLQP